jgi:hypothetical protein
MGTPPQNQVFAAESLRAGVNRQSGFHKKSMPPKTAEAPSEITMPTVDMNT